MKHILRGAIQRAINNAVPESFLLSSHITSNGAWSLYGNDGNWWHRLAESTKLTSERTLTSVDLYIYKTGSPTGTFYVRLYPHTGTYGSSSTPTGAYVATWSGSASILSTTPTWVNFEFDSSYVLSANTPICIEVIHVSGDSTNRVALRYSSNGGYVGNASATMLTAYTAFSGYDMDFKLYGY